MDVTQMAITDMPGMGLMEILFQWWGLIAQTGAAVGTVAAVWVALRVAGTQSRWRAEELARERVVVQEIVNSELGLLRSPLDQLMYQFGGGIALASLKGVPANAGSIARVCADLLETPKANQLIEKLGYLPTAREIGALLGALPTLQMACRQLDRKSGSGLKLTVEDIWPVGQHAHLIEWMRLRALGKEIDKSRFPYTEAGSD